MIIGDAAEFAVEYELDEPSGEAWMFGRLCYWVGGEMVGDYGLGTSLRDVLLQMKYVVGDCGNRFFRCSGISDEKLFDLVNDAIYGDSVGDDEEARFDVTIPVDVFAGVKIFLFDFLGEGSRLIYSNNNGGVVMGWGLRLGEFDSVIKRFYDELQGIYKRFEGCEC